MAEKNGTTRSSNTLTIILILVLAIIAGLSFVCIKFNNDLNVLKAEDATLKQEVLNKQKAYDEIDNKTNEITAELEVYKNVKEAIKDIKEDYFNKIYNLEQDILNDKTDVKIAYLTFDDGPYLLSENFLNVLDEYDVPATFFYLMKSTETNYDQEVNDFYDYIYRRVITSGHTLGNHTSIHKFGENGIYASMENFTKVVLDNRNFIYNRYGYTTEVFRFPGGSDTPRRYRSQMIEWLVENGYGYVDWNSATGDGGAVLSPEEYRDNVLNYTAGKNILVVLMHDYSKNTLAALPEIIEGLRDQGYTFLPLFNQSVACKKS